MPIGNLVPATDDTIVAIATPPTAAARGIVRMAGPQALACLCTGFTADAPAALANLRRPTAVAGRWTFRELGDRQLCCDAYIWPGVQSFSRQPTVELHLLGSPPLLEAIVDQCCAAGARLARPGEFTLRAFLAGRLDLVQAEAVLGLIDARDSAQFRTALQQLAAGLGGRLHALQGQLLDLLAELEAGLDFADEALDLLPAGQVVAQLADIARALQDFRSQLTRRSVAGRRLRVALIGPPNAGKSSLFNALTTQGQALVSPQAGTTRDYLVQPLQLGDLEIELIDTAGIESQQPQGAIDLAAQRQARLQSEQTDAVLVCVDSSQPRVDPQLLLTQDQRPQLLVWTKADRARSTPPADCVATSSLAGTGLDELRQRLRALLLDAPATNVDLVPATAARARGSLDQACEAVHRAQQIALDDRGNELIAAELRLALEALGEIVGTVYTDDILDRIFSRFCIGK